MKQQSDALRLADELRTHKQHPRYFFYEAAAAELCRLHQHELSNELWYKKTDWLQNSYTIAEVGMHRADVIKQRIDRLHSLNHELMEALKKANEQTEHFERLWYFRGDLIEELVEALEQITKVEYQSPVTMYQAMEDIAKAALAKARGTE